MKSLNIVFAGTPEFALPCLEALAESPHHLQAIYTQPDRPAGRGRQLHESAVKTWAKSHQIPVFQPENFKDKESLSPLEHLAPDVIIVIAYGLILPTAVLQLPRLGCINVHASLLPRWRGASPIQHALWYGDKETGITIMQMDKGMDTGAMLSRTSYTLRGDTAGELHNRLARLAVTPLLTTLNALSEGPTSAMPQDDTLATYAPKINKNDAAIDWNKSATAIDQLIRAFNPWPIAHTIAADEVLRIHQARVVTHPHTELPGTIITIDKKGMLVATGKDALLVERLQFPGGKIMSVADWLNAGRDNLRKHSVLK